MDEEIIKSDDIKEEDSKESSSEVSADEKKIPITKDMNIGYILQLHPESAVLLMSVGMGCITCYAAELESLAEACIVHGLDADDVVEYLNGELGLLTVEQ